MYPLAIVRGKQNRIVHCSICFVFISTFQLVPGEVCNNPSSLRNPEPDVGGCAQSASSGGPDSNEAAYCCPDYRCCSYLELTSLINDCPANGCPGTQECCDGIHCCTKLEAGARLDKCTLGSLCNEERFTRLECCTNEGLVSDGVCCTPEERLVIGARCFNQGDCSSGMECNDGACRFNITFDEDSIALFIILVIAAIVAIIVIAAQIACYIAYKMRKKRKEEEKTQGFKSPEVRRLSRQDPDEPRVVVQIPTRENHLGQRPPPQGKSNPAFDVSPEFAPVVRYYEREPRSGRAAHQDDTGSFQFDQEPVWSTSGAGQGFNERTASYPNGLQRDQEQPRYSRRQGSEIAYDRSNRRGDFNEGRVNRGYDHSNSELRPDLELPPPPPRSHSRERINQYSPERRGVVSYRPQSGRQTRYVEEEDENDTLVLGGTHSSQPSLSGGRPNSGYSQRNQTDQNYYNGNYRNEISHQHRRFASEERNIDDPDTPVPYRDTYQ